MAAGDDIRIARVRAWLTRYDELRAELSHALDDPIPTEPPPAPPTTPDTPQAAKRPGPANTGVPAGTKLTWSGTVTTTRDGQVIEDLDVLGMVKVKHNGVTIRRCRAKASPQAAGSDYPIKTYEGVTGLTLEDTEIDGNGRTSLCVGYKGYTMRRCNVHSAAGDLLRADGNVTVEDSWLHDIVRVPGGHHDAIQTLKGSRVDVLRNTIDIAQRKPDGTVDYMNACFIISAQAPVSDVLIEGNYLNGGNYTLYLGENDRGHAITDITVANNVFGPDVRPKRAITAKVAPVLVGNVDTKGQTVS